MSNEKPILFKDEMIRAILEGRKTQTRRIVKGIDHDLLNMMSEDIVTGEPDSDLLELICGPSTDDDGNQVPDQWMVRCTECPEEGVLTMGQGYGKPGDRLWVRETFQGPLVPYDQAQELFKHSAQFESPQYCEYRADGGPAPEFINADEEHRHGWRPSIHMPRWASRITLEITNVRVERLQDISEEDAIAEGARPSFLIPNSRKVSRSPQYRWGFHQLWESIYGQNSWDANPWVWVVEFKCIDQEAKAA